MPNSINNIASTRSEAAGSTKVPIYVLVDYFWPAFKAGGPIRSILNLTRCFGKGFAFRIISRDRDLGDRRAFSGTRVGQWNQDECAQVLYAPAGLRGAWKVFQTLKRAARSPVYLNSFFSRVYSILPMMMFKSGLLSGSTIVIAPRGEFSPGALEIKPRRKKAYLALCRWLGLYERVVWHASTQMEAQDIRRVFGKDVEISQAGPLPEQKPRPQKGVSAPEIVVAMDLSGPGTAGRLSRAPKIAGELNVVFVSRISEKKNLHFALQVLATVRSKVRFKIYGPREDNAYWARCVEVIASLPPNITVEYAGMVKHERVRAVFEQAEVFFFPTRGENYGHVIFEALEAGCPVLISDQTPWQGLEGVNAGWVIPLSRSDLFAERIEAAAAMGEAGFRAWSEGAGRLALEKSSDPTIIEDNQRLLLRALR